MPKAKASEFITYIKSKVGSAYLWGGQGEGVHDILAKYADTKDQSKSNTVKMLGFLEGKKGIQDIQFFDCSGLGVSYLLEQGAISYDMTADGIYKKCKKISKKEIQPSDMAFLLNSSGKATHIGYIVEGNTVIHALNQSVGVIREDLNRRKWVFGRPDFCLEYDLEEAKREYFETYKGTSGSIVDGLAAVGAKTSFSYRKEIAAANNFTNYTGTSAQNKVMLALLKEGKLIKP